MPELPEVEVVRAGIEPVIAGARIDEVHVSDERALTRHTGSAADFVDRLTGRTILAAVRRGKFLWFPFAADTAMVGHLGMSGQLLLGTPDRPPVRHERIRFVVSGADGSAASVVFVDQRTFGSLALDALVPTVDSGPGGAGGGWRTIPRQAAHIARDPLDPAFSAASFADRVSRSRSGIKRLLLDQTVVSGVGNIYADEALWGAEIHPDTPGADLSASRVERLLVEVRDVLTRALAEGGTSFDTQYVNVNGAAGYFTRSLRAYGRQGEPCLRCGASLVRERFMNRSSHICPACQRTPPVGVR